MNKINSYQMGSGQPLLVIRQSDGSWGIEEVN